MPALDTKKRDLEVFIKTVTDMYSGSKLEDILKAEWIVDHNGNPVKSSGDDLKDYEKIYDLVTVQGPKKKVYFQSVPSKEKDGKEYTATMEFINENYVPVKTDKVVIPANVKSETLLALADINEELQKYTGKNPDIKELKSNCANVILDLTKTVDKKEFNDKLNEFTKTADRFYASYGPASLKKELAKNANIAYDIIKIRNEVEKGNAPGKPDLIEEQQARIASKYVSAYCLHTIEKSARQDAIDEAKEILLNPKLFNEKVSKTMQDPTFMFLYGRRKEGDEKDLLQRLNEGLHTKAAGVFKKVEKERQFPTKDRLEIEEIKKQQPPKRIEEHKQYESMSLQEQKPIAQIVKSIREELDAIDKFGSRTSSPEYEKLIRELMIADIRLQRGSEFMDVKQQMAELGDAVDAYVNKKIQEKAPNGRGQKRLNAATRLRDLCDAVGKNKKPEEVVKSPSETAKNILAEKIVRHLANQMMIAQDPIIAKEGATIRYNKVQLEKETKKMLNSDTFKTMFNTPEKVQNALETKPAAVYQAMLKHEFKKADPNAIKNAKMEKQKENTVKKQEEQIKQKSSVKPNEKDEVMIEMQMI